MRAKGPGQSQLFGYAPVGLSRYLVLYATQAAWLVLGLYLLSNAYWPSTCSPDGLLAAYRCSIRLPENRGWVEAALLTWMWATPILALLEVSRHLNKPQSRPTRK